MAVIYNSHWRTWSRILSAKDGEFVELNLTHINGHWDKVKAETIRRHSTPRSPNDVVQEQLPVIARQALVTMVGAEFANKLLTYDYLSEVDWSKYRNVCSSGASFNDIQRRK